jgi:hypothetical protein
MYNSQHLLDDEKYQKLDKKELNYPQILKRCFEDNCSTSGSQHFKNITQCILVSYINIIRRSISDQKHNKAQQYCDKIKKQ